MQIGLINENAVLVIKKVIILFCSLSDVPYLEYCMPFLVHILPRILKLESIQKETFRFETMSDEKLLKGLMVFHL